VETENCEQGIDMFVAIGKIGERKAHYIQSVEDFVVIFDMFFKLFHFVNLEENENEKEET
jgi:hypothetical protein